MLPIWHILHLSMFTGFRTEGLPPAVWRGGESEALDRLNKHMDKKVNQKLRLKPSYCSSVFSVLSCSSNLSPVWPTGGYDLFLLVLFQSLVHLLVYH